MFESGLLRQKLFVGRDGLAWGELQTSSFILKKCVFVCIRQNQLRLVYFGYQPAAIMRQFV